MDQVLCCIPSAYVYIDDILLASATQNNTLRTCKLFFERLSAHGFVINPNKWLLGVHEPDFLSHRISKHGMTPRKFKLSVIFL